MPFPFLPHSRIGVGKQKRDLDRHSKSLHRKLKDFKCMECPRAFSQRSDLVIHVVRVHKKIKRFKCNICEVALTGSGDLKSHMKKHDRGN